MSKRWQRRNGNHVLRGMAAGAIGGLVGAFVMNQSGKAIGSIAQDWQKEKIALEGQKGGEHNYPEHYGKTEQESEDATQKAAGKIAAIAHRPVSKKQKKIAGPVIHYLFGAAVGAAYGAAAEKLPVNKAAGVPFGAAVWAAADELAVPAAGLAGSFDQYPASVHLKSLATHVVYGVTTEMVRRGMRHVI